jgi:hypothetical protein
MQANIAGRQFLGDVELELAALIGVETDVARAFACAVEAADAGGGTICGRERCPFGLGQRRSAWPKLLCRGESRQRWCQKLNGNGMPDRMKMDSQLLGYRRWFAMEFVVAV